MIDSCVRSLITSTIANKPNKHIHLTEVDQFNYIGSVLTRDGYYTKEIQMRIVIAEEAFIRKISLLRTKLNTELGKKLVRCYVWSIALYGSETWALSNKNIGAEVLL